MKIKIKLTILLVVFVLSIHAQDVSIIPQPSHMQLNEGGFVLGQECTLKFEAHDKELSRMAQYFNEYLQTYYGFHINLNNGSSPIQLQIVKNETLGNEGYRLDVSNNRITISANNYAGVFYGIQTLKQLLPLGQDAKKLKIPAITVEDQPRFAWRGLHLDVGRHFFPVSFLKKYIDYMAEYKLNTFHWHLTEDQGWRIEIKKYPKLTEISHWRDETAIYDGREVTGYDGIGYGGFYTQEQVKEIVSYANERYITVIPEIEMPGHSVAALAAYPELGCRGDSYQVAQKWGIFEDVYCAGKETTFDFLEDVLDEVCTLFPSQYIHIGGDECPKKRWEQCPHCQERIKKEGLEDEHQLQSYFIKRMSNYLATKGRSLIGWHEIMEGGIAPDATVMAWRGAEDAVKAAKMEHNVVMTPFSHLYFIQYQSEDKANEPFNYYKGILPLEKVYSYEPIPEELSSDESKFIIGAQGCVWTEFISNIKVAEFMLFPRICALAEMVWTPKEKKDYNNFESRMNTEYNRFDMWGINYKDYRK